MTQIHVSLGQQACGPHFGRASPHVNGQELSRSRQNEFCLVVVLQWKAARNQTQAYKALHERVVALLIPVDSHAPVDAHCCSVAAHAVQVPTMIETANPYATCRLHGRSPPKQNAKLLGCRSSPLTA